MSKRKKPHPRRLKKRVSFFLCDIKKEFFQASVSFDELEEDLGISRFSELDQSMDHTRLSPVPKNAVGPERLLGEGNF